MSSPQSGSPTVTTQKAWSSLMKQMGGTNMARARQARKAANMLSAYWGKR